MDNIFLILLSTIIGAVLGGFIFYLFKNKKTNSGEEIGKLGERLETANKIFADQFRQIREEISGSHHKELELRDKSSKDIRDQMEKFTGGFAQMTEMFGQVQSQIKEVSSFQTIFKSPKLTGQWGEASLDYMLSLYFPRRDAYELQYQFSSGEAADAILRLPNGRILPIDSKFPQDNFNQFINAVDVSLKEEARKSLVNRIKKDISDIATKYILPNENTMDFAMMYIPAESLYYEIVTKEDLTSFAWNKKVFLTSPNTFILTLGVIQHWFKDTDITKKTSEILKKLQRIAIDGEKLGESFRKLGSHISSTKSSYDDAEKRIGMLVDRVNNVGNLIDIDETKELK
ncbi:MAG: DNA recombination protein RmuC [Candidatus Azambacteria bacterium]|nr:DNA recombination protein RmuC [Candidatus Azambacteria bacterium]